ncbi:hypothetical protein JTB14_018003 [Gonioctena quinquepunctata]|nr:hypothetical protein JTB14_018003 [Gonioctena quinquepunctata]
MHCPYFLLLYLVVPLLIGITESVGTSSSHRMADLPQRRSMVKRDLAHQCVTPVCKESTAKMLHFINYNADPCEEFHEYVCGNEHGDMNSFSANNVGMIESYLTKINKNQSNKYLLDFQAFYRSCVNYDSTFNFMENMKFIKKYTSTNLTGVFTELILTQSMPFFDIGMDIQNADGSYMFQITLPGMSTLKTDLEDWSVFEQVERECEHIVDSSIFAETLDLKLLHESFKECRRSLLMKYSRKYNEDMQFALKSTGVGSKDILKELLESLEAMRVPDDSIRSPPIMEKVDQRTL